MHTSLDGFVAGENGEFNNFKPGPDNLNFVCELTKEADAALFGRVSFQLLDAHWPTAYQQPNATADEINYSRWYNSVEKIVLSKTLTGNTSTTVIGEDIKSRITQLKERPGKNILMFGSPTAYQALSKLDLIDSYWIIVYPVLFGKGIPLFSDMDNKVDLKRVSTRPLANGEIALHYEINRK